jgi:uncharacterized protein
MPTEITVRGTFSTFQSPERATVHATIAFEGPAMEPVYERVARDLEAVKASVSPLKTGDHGPVTWWSAEQLRTWSNRPWNKDGVQLPLVHHASVGIEVKFRDFASLSRWVGGHVANTDGFRVSHIGWALTSKRRKELQRQARIRAVEDAVVKAQEYAEALGLGSIHPIAIADAGMLGASLHPERDMSPANLRVGAAMGGAPDVELLPEDIEVSAAVDARFSGEDAAQTA